MQLYPSPRNPVPPRARCLPVMTRDRKLLRAMTARPEHPRGTVVLLGGRGDFLERYFETMRDLTARGFAVASLDVRGQGGSERLHANPYRGHIRGFEGFDEDLRSLMEEVVLPDCPPPYVALGHSTGGHILLRALSRRDWFARAVLVSPLVDVVYGPWPRPVAAALVHAAHVAGLGSMFLPGVLKRPMGHAHFPGNPLTSDAFRWHRDSGTLDLAPHLGLGGPTFSWLRGARRSFAEIARLGRTRPLKAPVLIVASSADRVVSNEAIRALARRVPGVALAMIPGARHEILHETDAIRRQFFAAFDSFVTLEVNRA